MAKAMVAEVDGEMLELISLEGVTDLLRENGHPTAYVCKGTSDEGNRWSSIVTATGDVLVHTMTVNGFIVGRLLDRSIMQVAK